ncbi:MAG TPA: AMP-binding protein [Bryobacteraceae bacterium]|nr:AMP-binding protein [Bryobacteraceae bacterium]
MRHTEGVVRERRNLASLIDDFQRHSQEIAIVNRRGLRLTRTSYGELGQLAGRFAAELRNRSAQKGDRVLLWGENSATWVGAFFGCVLRGVLPVPLDFASTVEFARSVEREVSPVLILGDGEKLKALESRRPSMAIEQFDDIVTRDSAGPIPDLAESDALQIVFTSGTTGEPKGVVHTHENVLASLRPIETEMQKYLKYERLVHPVRILHTLPLSHVFGQFMGLWIPPLLAAELHFESRLVAAELIERIHNERISALAAVPRVLELLQSHAMDRFPELAGRVAEAERISAWRRWWRFRKIHRLFGLKFWAFICGGASLSQASERFWTSLGFAVVQGYGMTETTALVSLNHPFRPAQGTIGQVLPGREVRLTDEGEVLVRGATISNATWQGGQIRREDSEWLATGDLAEFDENGNLRFRGRKKDVIVTSSGLNIYPDDLEAALQQQAGVKGSAVIETDTEQGPEPLAALVMTGDADPDAAVASANKRLAEFQRIRHWIVWPEADLPRTSTGKVLRREVARRIASGEVAAGTRAVSEPAELNLDSLGRVQLQAQLEEKYGVSLDDAALQQVKTQQDVQKLLQQPASAMARPQERAPRHIYPRWPWNPVMWAIRSVFLEAIAMPVLRFLAKPKRLRRVTGELPRSPMLIVSNHVSSYDPAFVLYALPGRMRRRVAIAMSGEMLLDFRRGRNQGNWFLNLMAPVAYLLITGLFNVFPLPQVSGFRRSFRHAGEAIDRGYNVLVFPEGQRSANENPLPYKSGSGLLWKELNVPLLPVRLHGLGALKESGERWFRSGKISVSVGDILWPEPGQPAEELTERLREAVLRQ